MPGSDAIGHALLFGRTYSENTVQLSRNEVVYVVYSSGFGVGSMMGRVHGILQACQGRVYETKRPFQAPPKTIHALPSDACPRSGQIMETDICALPPW
jgi:hypothetical protein